MTPREHTGGVVAAGGLLAVLALGGLVLGLAGVANRWWAWAALAVAAVAGYAGWSRRPRVRLPRLAPRDAGMLAMALVLVAGALVVSRVSAEHLADRSRFTELGSAGSLVTVVNREGTAQDYRLEIAGRGPLRVSSARVADGARWTVRLPAAGAARETTVRLFRAGDPRPYRRLRLRGSP